MARLRHRATAIGEGALSINDLDENYRCPEQEL
jgi:hypothetical protein